MEATGIPFVVIEYSSMASQMEAAKIIGAALGAEEEAALYVQFYQDAIDQAAEIAARMPESERKRLYHSVNEAVRTDPPNSLGADWIGVTGAIHVALGENLTASGSAAYTTLEQIYVWDPDLIICSESGVAGYILTDAQWEGLRAVREGTVYQVPIGVSRWGHPNSSETSMAILWLTRLLYPEYAGEIDLEEKMRYFYQTFFDYALSEEMIEKIFAGEGIRTPGTGS